MIPYIKDNRFLHLSKDTKIPIEDFDSSIVLSDLYIDNITIYCVLFADKIKAHTYHYMCDDQIENKKYLPKFVADKLILSYCCTPDIIGDLVSVKEIILHGDHNLDKVVLPKNATTQIVTLCDENHHMDLCLPNVIIRDYNEYSGIIFDKSHITIGTNVKSIIVSTYRTDALMMLNLLKLFKYNGIKLQLDYQKWTC